MKRLNSDNWTAYKQYPEKVLQFGEGNFMRAFVDWQIHTMNQKRISMVEWLLYSHWLTDWQKC